MPATNRLRELRLGREPRPKMVELAQVVRRDTSTYHRYETGAVPITSNPEGLRALADFYGVSVEYLLGWDRDGAAQPA